MRSGLSLPLTIFICCELWSPAPAWGFPPYRSTDAETADEGALELRVGLLGVERESQENAYFSPLLRANLGLPGKVELVSELEYRADESEVTDAALGFKWVPLLRSLSLGVENLLLLPVSADDDGVGVESVLLATLRRGDLRIHLNAGGFHDARPDPTEKGWRAGVIFEVLLGRLRPGIEVFAQQVKHERVQVQGGPGVIIDGGPFDLRAGLRVGVTHEAPDLTFSLWVTTKWPIWKGARAAGLSPRRRDDRASSRP